mgnify:CR=1 FL=1
MNKYLTDDCINCNKFSHCNNNDLICISKYKIKKQECEKLKKRLESFQKDYSKLYQVVENKGYIKELDQLKAENDKLKQTLDEIENYKIDNNLVSSTWIADYCQAYDIVDPYTLK